MLPAIEMVREAGAIAEAAICYTGDIDDPQRDRYALDYYVELAKDLEKPRRPHPRHQGHGGPAAALRGAQPRAGAARRGRPARSTSTPTTPPGVQAASLLFAAEAGVDVVDSAFGAMSSLTSQPNLESIVAALAHQERDTGLDFDTPARLHRLLGGGARSYYAPFESGLQGERGRRLHPRDPGRPVQQPAARRPSRWASATACPS